MATEVFTDPELLAPPIQRAAYSDRTALIMAELSALAYMPFEGETGRKELMAALEKGGLELVETFNKDETQAFLVKQDAKDEKSSGIVVLSFRGTQLNLQDWKTDLDGKIQEIEGIRIHKGFWHAFLVIEEQVTQSLKPLLDAGYVLYITGHSLGGALALIATNRIGNDSTGACYTFGSPRIAAYGFDQKIKTPIYRVVNSNDIVPNSPPQYFQKILVYLLSLIKKSWAEKAAKSLDNYVGYVHHGDMRYLTKGKNEQKGEYYDVMLLSNPGLLDRLAWWFEGLKENWKGGAKEAIDDHSIGLYCAKLRTYAKKRN